MQKTRQEKIDQITALLLKHRERLVSLCIKKAHGDIEEVHDLVQDIMLHACKRRDELPDGESRRERWLFSVARSVMFRHRQRKQRRPALIKLCDDPVDDTSDEQAASDLMDLAREALDDSEIRVLQLRIEGYTYDEIGAATGASGATMRKQMERIIDKIRKHHNIKTD